MSTFLYEILVPTVSRKTGKPISTRFHRVWDAKVREISKGLTILKPAKGQWVCPNSGVLYTERMIPVRIACGPNEISKIASMTCEYYDQLAVMYYKISDFVVIKERENV
jgi:hypothetical protein